jgi:hypothetical protein
MIGLAIGLMAATAALTFHNNQATAYPEPAIITTAWQFDIEFDRPRVISVRTPGTQQVREYWYLPYTVTNNTGEDRLWVPQVTIYNSAGEVVSAGKGIPPVVFDRIKQQLENELLERPINVVGQLLQGADNARDSVFIWPVSKEDVDSSRVFIGGLSGETALVEDPAGGDPILLRKTLLLEYQTPGYTGPVELKPVKLVRQDWVMR